MEKKEHDLNRARQFMPFAALRGFGDLIREQEQVPEARRTLTEEDAARLSRRLLALECGTMASVTYYNGRAYRTLVGMISEVDLVARRLRVVKTDIRFDDLYAIERTEL